MSDDQTKISVIELATLIAKVAPELSSIVNKFNESMFLELPECRLENLKKLSRTINEYRHVISEENADKIIEVWYKNI